MSTDVDSINAAISDEPAPTMPPPTDDHVTLLGGTVAQVREMTGEDEEYLAAIEKRDGLTFGDYLTEILVRTVVRLDGEVPTKKQLNALLTADRDILFLAAVKATYGPERTINVICNHCDQKNDVVIELDEDFPVRRPLFDLKQGLEVVTHKGIFHLSLPTGEMTAAAAKLKNDAEVNTYLISQCAIFDGDAPADRLDWARKLNSGVRNKLIDALLAVEVGPKMGAVNTHCAHCSEEMNIAINWVSLLLG